MQPNDLALAITFAFVVMASLVLSCLDKNQVIPDMGAGEG